MPLLQNLLSGARLLKSTIGDVGPFEFEVLHAVNYLRNDAYGAKVSIYLSEVLRRDVAMGQVYIALARLQEKGFVSSRMSDPEPRRGGRAKRVFRLEAPGVRALEIAAAAANAAGALHATPKESHGKGEIGIPATT